MNVKIKSSGVSCLIGDDYDRVYTALKNSLNKILTIFLPNELPVTNICNGSYQVMVGLHYQQAIL